MLTHIRNIKKLDFISFIWLFTPTYWMLYEAYMYGPDTWMVLVAVIQIVIILLVSASVEYEGIIKALITSLVQQGDIIDVYERNTGVSVEELERSINDGVNPDNLFLFGKQDKQEPLDHEDTEGDLI